MIWEQHLQPSLQSSRILMLVLILTAGLFSASESHVRQGSLSRLPENDDVLFTEDVLGEVPVRSRTECSRQCVETERCVMATFYNTSQGPPGLCRLFGQVHSRTDPTVSQETVHGARSFTRRCVKKYFISGGRCLRMVNEEVIFDVALQRCNESGQGQLVMPQTLADVATIQQLIIAKGMTRTWVGASDKGQARQFRWNDGTPLADDSPLWCKERGEPENFNPGNDCVRVQYNYPYLFDRSCLDTHPYTCQRGFL